MAVSQLVQEAPFRPEDRLLLYASRVAPGAEARRKIRRLAEPSLDWTYVLTQARKHEVEPLLQKHTADLGREQVPDGVQEELDERTRTIAFRNLQQARELVRVVETLEKAGIAVIPFKGPVIGQLAYGNLAYRQFIDLDLLVQRSEFWRAKAVFQELGYRPYRNMTDAEEKDHVESQLGYEFVHTRQPFVIELHWNFFFEIYAFRLDPKRVWDRHIRIPFAGARVRSMAAEDILIYLCAHGTKHRWLKLKWLCDVAELARMREGIDWDTVLDRAQAIGSERMLLLGLYLAHHLLQAPVPKPVRQKAEADSVVRDMAMQVSSEWLFCAPDIASATPAEVFWFHFKERERWRDRWPHLWHHIQLALTPTEEDRTFVRLPEVLSFLYYLVRPVRIAWEKIIGGSTTGSAANKSKQLSRLEKPR